MKPVASTEDAYFCMPASYHSAQQKAAPCGRNQVRCLLLVRESGKVPLEKFLSQERRRATLTASYRAAQSTKVSRERRGVPRRKRLQTSEHHLPAHCQ